MNAEQFKRFFPHASADTIRKNFPDRSVADARVAAAPGPSPPKSRLRQQTGQKLNKTEAAFFEHLKATMLDHHHYAQSITLLLANGCRYTPDFISVSKITGMWIAHETKGFMRDDAGVKIKVAASVYPSIQFRLVTKRKGGGWDVQEILP